MSETDHSIPETGPYPVYHMVNKDTAPLISSTLPLMELSLNIERNEWERQAMQAVAENRTTMGIFMGPRVNYFALDMYENVRPVVSLSKIIALPVGELTPEPVSVSLQKELAVRREALQSQENLSFFNDTHVASLIFFIPGSRGIATQEIVDLMKGIKALSPHFMTNRPILFAVSDPLLEVTSSKSRFMYQTTFYMISTNPPCIRKVLREYRNLEFVEESVPRPQQRGNRRKSRTRWRPVQTTGGLLKSSAIDPQNTVSGLHVL